MKLKTKWQQNYINLRGERKINYEFMDTPFGRITICLDECVDRYEEPYKLYIPGNDLRYFESPVKAKQFTEEYLQTAITRLIDTTP